MVGMGVRGVLVGGRVAVGVTRLTEICNDSPTFMLFGSVRLLVFTISSTVLLNLEAMPASESPAFTT